MDVHVHAYATAINYIMLAPNAMMNGLYLLYLLALYALWISLY